MKLSDFGRALVVGRLQMGVDAGRDIRKHEIAKKLGVSVSYLCEMEHGNKIPNVAMLTKIRKIYPPRTLVAVHLALGIGK